MNKWKCEVCGYIHEGDNPSGACPVCGAGVDRFTELSEASEEQSVLSEEFSLKSSNLFSSQATDDEAVKKVPAMATEELSFDTYYFKPGQVLEYHRHPTGDQIFVFIKGSGVFYLDEGREQTLKVEPGSVVLAPKNVWHKIVNNGDGILVASQATKQPAGMEPRNA